MVKHNEILIRFASKPEFIAYIESFKSQIKELTERLLLYCSCSNQNGRNIDKPLSTDFLSKRNPIIRIAVKRGEKDMDFKKIIQERFMKWLIIFIGLA